MPKILKNISELESFLATIVREAIDDTGAVERRRQERMVAQTAEQDASGEKEEVEEAEGDEEAEKTQGDEEVEIATTVEKPTEKEVATATRADIFKTLNIMRSGRSLKDPDVKKALTSYITQLTTGEQQSLYAFLSGLAEMMVGGESGKEATDPGQAGIRVDPTEKSPEEEIDVDTKTIKVSVSDEEETPDAVPIVVGEAADKSAIRRRIRELHG